jgi:phosphohistidine swiveling domain-containing protein
MTEFPIIWEESEQARFWFWDQSHWPHPTTPLSATFELPAMAEGFTRACRVLRRPFPAYHVKVVNGFVYFGFDLVTDPAERAAAAAAHAATLAPRIADVARFWTDEVLPEVLAANDRMRFTNWDALPDTELAAALDELYALRVRQWELHDLVLVPAMAALSDFLALYARRFPDAPPGEAHALLRGLPNKTVEAAITLWRLAQGGPHPPTPSPSIGRGGAGDLPSPRIGGGPGGEGLPPALRAYLDEYGWRTDGWELSDPALREEPTPLLVRLRRYAAGDHPDPERALARAAEERERLTAAALARLPDAAARAEFMTALTAARAYPVLSEDHNFYIDQMGLTALRVPLLAIGRRLTARGLIAAPDDVFYLTREEVAAFLASSSLAERTLTPQPPLPMLGEGEKTASPSPVLGPSVGPERSPSVGMMGSPQTLEGEPHRPLKRLGVRAAARRTERARWWSVRPPATIGTPLPPDLADDPLYAGFFGVGAEPPRGERVLRGVGAVPGVAAGRARVVQALVDADRLAPGDVLVCPMTSPAWTPLFATAVAVVADAGGILSHTAIVAREFGIPCVVATRTACRDLVDGEWIEVDGSAGEVRRLGM